MTGTAGRYAGGLGRRAASRRRGGSSAAVQRRRHARRRRSRRSGSAIDPDVDALAALLAARAVDAAALGRAVRRLGLGQDVLHAAAAQARVAELASEHATAGELQKDVAWHKRIVQIEFNAWHYAEGNLWASLVAHILDNLRLPTTRTTTSCESGAAPVLAQITRPARRSREAATTDRASGRARGRAEERAIELQRELASSTRGPAGRQSAAGRPGDGVLAVAAARCCRRAGRRHVSPSSAARSRTRARRLTRGVGGADAAACAPTATRTALAGASACSPPAPIVALRSSVARRAGRRDRRIAGAAALIGGAAAWLQRQVEWTRGAPRRGPARRAAAEPPRQAQEADSASEVDAR